MHAHYLTLIEHSVCWDLGGMYELQSQFLGPFLTLLWEPYSDQLFGIEIAIGFMKDVVVEIWGPYEGDRGRIRILFETAFTASNDTCVNKEVM
jgi:hypothetical protein